MKKFKSFIKNNLRWILLLISVIIVVEIIEALLENDITNFDNEIYTFISSFISPGITTFAKIITTIGSAYVIIPVCIILIIIFRKSIEKILIPLNLVITFVANQLLKRIIARPRPNLYRLVEETGFSFPSGHSMISMAFYGFIIYLIYRKVKNLYIKWTLCITLSILIVLIGITRIYLGVHYASDVIAGFFISIAYLTLFTNVIKNKIKE